MKRIKNSPKTKETINQDCYEDEIVDQIQILRSLVLSRSGGVSPDLLRQWVKSGRDWYTFWMLLLLMIYKWRELPNNTNQRVFVSRLELMCFTSATIALVSIEKTVQTFDDVINNNKSFVSTFEHEELTGTAKEGLAIVTCMDSRISPLAVVGMKPGDAKILRNAGARVTDDVLRTLVLASYLLGVKRILIMPHTDCRMANSDEAGIHEQIKTQYGVDTTSIEFKTVKDQKSALIADVEKVRSFPLLNDEVVVMGAIYDVATGKLEPLIG